MADYRDPSHLDPNGNFSITQLVKFIREKMFGIDVRESIAKGLERVYEDASKDGNANMEVSQARGVFSFLKDRLDDIDRVSSLKPSKTYVDTVLSSIASGGPKELFYSLAALQAKYPSGAEGTYLVFDASHEDGAHSYMWNGSIWEDLGPYQPMKVNKGSVGAEELNGFLKDATMVERGINFNAEYQNWLVENNKAVVGDNINIRSVVLDVKPKEFYRITVSSGGYNTASIIAVDGNFNIIDTDLFFGDGTARDFNDYEYIVKEGTYKMIVQGYGIPIVRRLDYVDFASMGWHASNAINSDVEYVLGSLDNTTGVPLASNVRIRTPYLYFPKRSSIRIRKNDIIGNVAMYNMNKEFLGRYIESGSGYVEFEAENDMYVRLVLGYRNNRSISDNMSGMNYLKNNVEVNVATGHLMIDKSDIFEKHVDFEHGSIRYADGSGSEFAATNRVRSGFLKVKKGTVLTNDHGLIKMVVGLYDNNGIFITHLGNLLSDQSHYLIEEDSTIKIVLSHIDDEDIVSISDVTRHFHMYTLDVYEESSSGSSDVTYRDSGRTLVGILDVNINQEIEFVGDELWSFHPSIDDDFNNTSIIHKYNVDFETMTSSQSGSILHNFGHCNSVSYCEQTDTLILGNGSSSYSLANKIFIVDNFSSYLNTNPLDIRDIGVIIDLSTYDFGAKVNAAWGESNFGSHDIAYLTTNDQADIRKIQLGRGTNNLGEGQFIIGKSENEFNGSFRLIDHKTQTSRGYDDCVQGSKFHNGVLYAGVGHNEGVFIWENHFDRSDTVKRVVWLEKIFSASGSRRTITTHGMTIKNGYLLVAATGNKVLVYNLN